MIINLANLAFWVLLIVIELQRRRRGVIPELPFSLMLILIALNTLLFDNLLLFRFGAFAALMAAIYETRLFVQRGTPELTLAGALVSGGFGALVLVYWAVISINEHLNLAMG